MLQGTPDHSVNGLVYRTKDGIAQNPRPELVADLDSLPDIDYSLIGLNDSSAKFKKLPIDAGRGCPFGCSYCSTSSFWSKKYRLKSPEKICDEIKSLHDKYGISRFAFMHDMFTFNRKQITSICRSLKELDFPILWSCSARIDCIDNEIIDTMIDAGMRDIYIGVETGSQRMQKLIHKNLKLDSVLPRLKYIHSKGIHITVSFIYGFPEETLEDLSQTLCMIREIAKIDNVKIQTHLCAFLPGTELSAKYAKEMEPAHYFSDISGSLGVKDCEDIITSHPEVFPQFLEYKTPLRNKLEHFSLFVTMWRNLQPIYQYISEKYEENRLIDMYFDFLECNSAVLEEAMKMTEKEGFLYIIEHDNLPQNFIPDELKGIVKECYRLVAAPYSPMLKELGEIVDVFNICPDDFKQGSCITDYREQPYLVKHIVRENGKPKRLFGKI